MKTSAWGVALGRVLALALASVATAGACSGSAQSGGGVGNNVGGASTPDAAGMAGNAVAATPGGAGGAAGANGDGPGPFVCSTYIGASLSAEWWAQGFENIVDGARWQLKWHHHGFIEAWGDPQSPFWADDGDPSDDAAGAPITSACEQNATTPDRVVFLAMDWVLLTEQGWIDWLEKDVAAIRAKYPSVKWIDLMPTVRCPHNAMCNPDGKRGPGANDSAGPEDCYIPPFEDSAIAKVVAAHPDSVGLGPVVTATMCNVGAVGAHLTVADNQLAATAIGNFYKASP